MDLTKVTTKELKKSIFLLCQFISPETALVEGDKITHIFHSMKISECNGIYNMEDNAREKNYPIQNKYILELILRDLECIIERVHKEAEEEISLESFAENMFTGEPDPVQLEHIEKEIREVNITKLEEEV